MGSLAEVFRQRKVQIIQDYIDGVDMGEIVRKYGFKYKRTVYYHLEGNITESDKKIRRQNRKRLSLSQAQS